MPVANFYLTRHRQVRCEDEGKLIGRRLELLIHWSGRMIPLVVTEQEFVTSALYQRILQAAGTGPILYGTHRDLAIASQEFSGADVDEVIISTSAGFNAEGNYLAAGMLITPRGIEQNPGIDLDLSGGNFSKNLAFAYPEPGIVAAVGEHLYINFLKLKRHAVMYPLMGHACLAPFTSQIYSTGRKRPALHLQGPSGCGKLFLATLIMSLFGRFDNGVISWGSTHNAIEMEGYYFRDVAFLVDDFKIGNVPPKVFTSVIQKYADGAARSRLRPNGKLGNVAAIRGLLISTGEDFLPHIESVSGRTILLQLEPDINRIDGRVCWQSRDRYRSFLPGLIHMVISQPNWKLTFRDLVEGFTELFLAEITGVSNGFRLASNWALNAWGFHQFVAFLVTLKVIDEPTAGQMQEEYKEIAIANLKEHAERLSQENPVSLFFEGLGERIAAGEVFVDGLPGTLKTGQQVGVAKPQQGMVDILCDPAIEAITKHLRTTGQKCPTKTVLRDALAGEKLISRVKEGRWTVQVRLADGARRQAWEINLNEFVRRCNLDSGEHGDEEE